MRVLTESEVAEHFLWFEKAKPESDYVHADKDGLYFTHPEACCIDLPYPPKLERLPFFARCLATIGYEEHDFNGALIWHENWGVWNPRDEGVGYRIVEQMNVSAGQPKSFDVGRGYQFRADELTEAIGMLMQPMIFSWDCFYLPAWSYGTGQFFLHVSHDSSVDVVTRTREFHERVFQHLEELELKPTLRNNDMRTNRFCRRR